jgi:DNA-binding CsgD family transcriptional regulator
MSAPAVTRSLDRLVAARHAGGGHAVLRVLAEHWDELRSEHPRELLLTLDAMSEQVLRGNPQLRLYRRYLEDHLDPAIVRTISRGGPLQRLRSLTRHAVAARTLGRTAIAARRVDAARHFLSTLPADVLAQLAPALPSLRDEWAATYVQVGRFSDALAQFTEALEATCRAGDPGAAVASGGGAALLHVMEGRGRDASAVLDAVASAPGSDAAGPSSTPGLIAQAWIHLDRLDHAGAAVLLARVCIADAPAYWAPYFVARVSQTAARREGRETLLADFDRFIHSLAARGVGSSAHTEMVAAVRQLLIVQLQRSPQGGCETSADATSDRTGLLPQLEAIVRARNLVDRGRADDARRVLRPLLEVDESRPRVLIPALLLVSEIDAGQNAEAHLRRAGRLALSHRHFSPFLNSPPEIRRWAAAAFAAGGEEAVADRIRSLPPRTVARDPGELSGREMDVVELAVDGLKNVEIAARLHLSPNTVKSHLRSAYGKLGVSTKKHLAERMGARA